MESGIIRGAETEPSTVVVNQNWDLLGRISEFWKVKPGADADPGVNDDILGNDPGGGVGGSRGELRAEVALDEAAFVDADAGERLVDELLVDLGRRNNGERGDRGGSVGVGGGHGGRRGGEKRGGPEPEEEEEEREEDDKAGAKATEVEKERVGH